MPGTQDLIDTFFALLCGAMEWTPTPWRMAALREWARHEGMPLATTFNPLATTRRSPAAVRNAAYDFGFGAGIWNSVGVGVYRDMAAGVAATAETLQLPYYPNIRRCFVDENAYDEAVAEFATYVGSEAYGTALVAYMASLPPDPDPDQAEVALLLRLFSGDEEADLPLTERLRNARYRIGEAGPSVWERLAALEARG
jgi:hypothetical protein